jgi:hypothetical protein
MNDRNLIRGIFLVVIAAIFGFTAATYPFGTSSRPGPGFFPILVAGALALIGISTIIRSRFIEKVPFEFNPKNISLILGSLCALALVSEFVNMTAGIAVMVFIAGFAASSYSVVRNIQIAAGLIAVAFAFQKLLGLNLPLY